jgi:hypothetical protein
MGWGDEIIASGQARALQRHDPRPVLIIDRNARPRWSPIWDHNPRLARDRAGGPGKFQSLLNGPGVRPYVEQKLATRWVWRGNFRCEPGEIYLTEAERAFAAPWRGRVLVEPNLKDKPEQVNKRWAFERWQALADLRLAEFVQVGPPGTRLLRGVEHAVTQNFRLACAVLSVCRGFVGHEGGLHHAAAALRVPAVVLFSGFISPAITGYETQRNIHHGGAACGSRLPCLHCRESMEAISVEEVAANLRALA